MPKWVEILVDKPDNLGFIPWSHIVEEENKFLHTVHYMYATIGVPHFKIFK